MTGAGESRTPEPGTRAVPPLPAELLRAALVASPVALALVDRALGVLFANPAFASRVGAEGPLAGTSLARWLSPGALADAALDALTSSSAAAADAGHPTVVHVPLPDGAGGVAAVRTEVTRLGPAPGVPGGALLLALDALGAPGGAPESPARARSPRPAARREASARNALLVEDDRGVALLVRRMLELLGWTVTVLDDPLAALAHDAPIDVLLCDVSLPRLRGTELAARLRERAPALPIVFLSGRRVSGDEVAPLRPAVALLKPFTLADLERALVDVRGAARAPG